MREANRENSMRLIGLLLVATVFLIQAPTAQAPPPIQAVGTMSELMIRVIYPTSNAIFYITTRTPATEEQWEELQGKALMLAESANLLMLPGRARDQDGWIKDAKLLLDAGNAAFKAAKAKDVEALAKLNDALYAACVTCHQEYRPRRRSAPPDSPAPKP
jgi:hypothetical protein